MATLASKLQIKAAQLAVLNPPEGYLPQLQAALAGPELVTAPAVPAEAALVFVHNLAELAAWVPQAIAAVRRDGLLWVAYPKGASGVKTDVNRDRLWEAVLSLGWRPVRQIALDEVWSALRFRPAEDVGRS